MSAPIIPRTCEGVVNAPALPSPHAGEGKNSEGERQLGRRRRDIARRYHPIPLEVQLEDRRLADLLVIHLALVLGAAIQQDPGRLQRVGMADKERYLVGVLAGDTVDDIEHAPAERLDRFVAGEASAAELVHEEAWPPHRHLPAAHALQITTELGFAQLRLWDQGNRRRQLRVPDLGGFPGAAGAPGHAVALTPFP